MKILLASDGSAYAHLAETLVLKLPAYRSAQIDVATAVSPPAIAGFGTFQPLGGYDAATQAHLAYEQSQANASEISAGAAKRIEEAGRAAHAVVLEGEPGNALLEYSESGQFDLIALGSRGHGGLRSFLLGSVARKLVNHARSSVLVARAYEGEEVERSVERLQGKERLTAILAYDGSQGARHALEWVRSQGDRAFERLIVVVVEPLSATPFGVDPAVFRETYRQDHEKAVEIAREAADALNGAADEVIAETIVGRPVEMLNKQAAAKGADLIVIGATRQGVIQRFFLGSVSYEAATSAPCSVAVVRPPHQNSEEKAQ
jgi:nucleotide-binding universal stress UspA family protein